MTNLEKYANEHWKSVVFCKECKWYQEPEGCPMQDSFIGEDDYLYRINNTVPDGWCYKGERE